MGFLSLGYPYMSSSQKRHSLYISPATEKLLGEIRLSKQPVLFLLPHVCLFETLVVSPYFRPKENRENGAVYRPNRNTIVDNWIRDARIANGVTLFPGKKDLRKQCISLGKIIG